MRISLRRPGLRGLARLPEAREILRGSLQYQKQRWFKKGQKWRTGCEGRISLLKRRHGLRRSLYKKDAGLKRWVGFGAIADNLISIGSALAK